jgi:Tfp pilus assembly protein PilO
MYNKTIISIILFILGLLVVWNFAMPFKEAVVDPISIELTQLKEGKSRYENQLNLKNLQSKLAKLSPEENSILETYVPKELHSGKMVYTLSQTASQNRLNLKNIQYSIIDNVNDKAKTSKKLSVEFQVDGFYENIVAWISQLEKSDILIDIESIKMSKSNNTNDILTVSVKMSVYGISIE